MNTKKFKYKKSGFKVPDNYFEDLEAKLLDRISAAEESALPSGIKSGFKVPEGYFENVEDRILEKIEPTKVISIFRKRKIYYAAAVAAVFIGLLSTYIFAPFNYTTNEAAEISAIEQYIDEGDMDLNSDDISSYIYDEGYIIDNISNIGVNDEAVVDYLSENVEDPSLIFQ